MTLFTIRDVRRLLFEFLLLEFILCMVIIMIVLQVEFGTQTIEVQYPADPCKEADFPSILRTILNTFDNEYPPANASLVGKCECALFTSKNSTNMNPLVSQAITTVNCTLPGQEKCLKICADDLFGPHQLCPHLKSKNLLQASLHGRVCGEQHWTYTGTTVFYTICCLGDLPITCDNQFISDGSYDEQFV